MLTIPPLETRGFDGAGNFVITQFDSDELATNEETWVRGVLAREVASSYTSGKLSLQTTTLHTASGPQTVTCSYDSAGHKLTETLAGNATTTYTYTDGRLTELEDPLGNVTTWTYSTNQVEIEDPDTGVTTMTYAGSNPTSVIDRRGWLRTYDYTDGKLTTETWYSGSTTGTTALATITFVYDDRGRLQSNTKVEGGNTYTYEFTYGDQDQLIHVLEPFGEELSFGYDEQTGYRNLVVDSRGGVEQSIYNASGQLVSRILTQDGTTDVTLRVDQEFDPYGRIEKQTRSKDGSLWSTTEYTYAPWDGQITSIESRDSGNNLISQFDYTYDATGQMTSKIENQPDVGSSATSNFDYDGQGQLTDDDHNTYTYDENGNRNYGSYLNQATGNTNQLDTDGDGWAYTYDAEGNVETKSLSGTVWTYEYDHLNHLTHATKTVASVIEMEVKYDYDGFANRIQKEVDADGFGTGDPAEVTQFSMDGWNNTKSPNPIGNENWDTWGDYQVGGDETRYLRGDTVDELLARIENSGGTLTPYFTTRDNLGSIRDIQSGGTTWESVAYDSYGNISSAVPATIGRYQWTGRERDVETELQYNRARYYDPKTGRWISQDPLGFDAGDSNLFRYVKNNPTASNDPSGLVLLVPNNIHDRLRVHRLFYDDLKLDYRDTVTPDYKFVRYDISMNHPADIRLAKISRLALADVIFAAAGGENSPSLILENGGWGSKTYSDKSYKVGRQQRAPKGQDFFVDTFGDTDFSTHTITGSYPIKKIPDWAWAELRFGCIGLLRMRLGIKNPVLPWNAPGTKAFSKFEYADQHLKSLKNPNARIFAMQWEGGLSDPEGNYISGKRLNSVPAGSLPGELDLSKMSPFVAAFDYCSLIRPADGPPIWESMNGGFSDPEPTVVHRRALSREGLGKTFGVTDITGGYPYTIYCVTVATTQFRVEDVVAKEAGK